MWPQADVPITQLSIQMHRSPEEHFKIGEALRPLVNDPEVILIATGTWTHNLGEFFTDSPVDINATPAAYAVEFSSWMHDRVKTFHMDDLFQYRKIAPHAYRAHPTADHILGLFVAMGASQKRAPKILHHSFVYGSLAMTHIQFD
jgi:4,5-DOPA dioxygenase extradiol